MGSFSFFRNSCRAVSVELNIDERFLLFFLVSSSVIFYFEYNLSLISFYLIFSFFTECKFCNSLVIHRCYTYKTYNIYTYITHILVSLAAYSQFWNFLLWSNALGFQDNQVNIKVARVHTLAGMAQPVGLSTCKRKG